MPKGLKILLTIVGVVVAVVTLFVVMLFVFVNSATADAQKVSDQFINNVKSGDSAGAYGLTNSTFQSGTSAENMSTVVNQIRPTMQGTSKITERKVLSENGATYTVLVYTFTNSSNQYEYVKTELQKASDNSWQVVNMRASSTPLKATFE